MVLIAKETIEQQVNRLLEESIIYYNSNPVGALAATDSEREALNYKQRRGKPTSFRCGMMSRPIAC